MSVKGTTGICSTPFKKYILIKKLALSQCTPCDYFRPNLLACHFPEIVFHVIFITVSIVQVNLIKDSMPITEEIEPHVIHRIQRTNSNSQSISPTKLYTYMQPFCLEGLEIIIVGDLIMVTDHFAFSFSSHERQGISNYSQHDFC